jgi:uncharacterized protein YcbK (DUF882 family)
MDVGVLDLLDAVGETKVTILSAYRTAETNAMLARTMFGVAEHSQRILSRALNISLGSKLAQAMCTARDVARRCRVVPELELHPHRHRAGAQLDARRQRL